MTPPDLPVRTDRHQRDGQHDTPEPEPTSSHPEIDDRTPLWEVTL